MGKSVHEALHWAYEKKKNNQTADIAQIIEEYKNHFNNPCQLNKTRVIKAKTKPEDYSLLGEELLHSYYSRIFQADESRTLHLEHKFEITINENIIYRGIIDRISQNKSERIRLIDYKTGRVGNPLENLQLPSYAVYTFRNYMDDQIELCYEDLKKKRTLIAPLFRKEVKKIETQLYQEIQQILTTSEFTTSPSILCQWCGFNLICTNPHKSVSIQNDQNQAAVPQPVEAEGCCPDCGSELRERAGKFGSFLGCSNYPQCKYTFNINPVTKAPASTADAEGKDICPECGSLLKERKGKYGPFIGCSGFPQCRFTRKVD